MTITINITIHGLGFEVWRWYSQSSTIPRDEVESSEKVPIGILHFKKGCSREVSCVSHDMHLHWHSELHELFRITNSGPINSSAGCRTIARDQSNCELYCSLLIALQTGLPRRNP
jgi:hypothetical protein